MRPPFYPSPPILSTLRPGRISFFGASAPNLNLNLNLNPNPDFPPSENFAMIQKPGRAEL